MAARFVNGCESCFGRRCPRRCKMDGRSAGVLPALATGRAALIDNCTVTRIEADAGSVTGLTCQRDGQTLTFAEMSAAEKNRLSHRADALSKFIAALER